MSQQRIAVRLGFGDDMRSDRAAPAGTPRPILQKLYKEIARALASPDVKKRLESYDFQILPAARIKASNSNSCAATSPAPRSPTNA